MGLKKQTASVDISSPAFAILNRIAISDLTAISDLDTKKMVGELNIVEGKAKTQNKTTVGIRIHKEFNLFF